MRRGNGARRFSDRRPASRTSAWHRIIPRHHLPGKTIVRERVCIVSVFVADIVIVRRWIRRRASLMYVFRCLNSRNLVPECPTSESPSSSVRRESPVDAPCAKRVMMGIDVFRVFQDGEFDVGHVRVNDHNCYVRIMQIFFTIPTRFVIRTTPFSVYHSTSAPTASWSS